MTPSSKILELVVVRFLCRRNGDLTWVVSPYAAPWIAKQGVEVSNALLIAPTDEWRTYRDLRECELLVHSRHEYFAEVVGRLIEQLPKEVDRYTGVLRPDEYRILLVYAGQGAYDFFARDHRFGPPPRGKVYRSNLRRGWAEEKGRAPRPDVAVLALRRKIARLESMGAGTADLKEELARREGAVARGEDPMAGHREYDWKKYRKPTDPESAVERLRAAHVGEKSGDGEELRPGRGEEPDQVKSGALEPVGPGTTAEWFEEGA